MISIFQKAARRSLVAVVVCFCMLAVPPAQARAASISAMRIGQGFGQCRIVFDADRKFDYKGFSAQVTRAGW